MIDDVMQAQQQPGDPKVRILIIEDDVFFRRALQEFLSMEGYEVSAAGSVLEIHPGLKQVQPDLILCDISLPGQSGLELLKSIRADPATASIPVLMLTATAERAVMREAMQDGADDYITKPVTAAEILAAIRTRLARLAGRKGAAFVSGPAGATTIPAAMAAPLVGGTAGIADAMHRDFNLSPRELDVLRGLVLGRSNSEIGNALGIAESTVKRHLLKVFLKLGVGSRTAAVVHCHGNPSLLALVNSSAAPAAV